MLRSPRIALLAALFVLAAGCASPPEAQELPADETQIIRAAPERQPEPARSTATGPETGRPHGPTGTQQSGPDPLPVTPADPFDALPFHPLELRDVRGGELTIELPAPPEAVAAMLLDFENADDHRAWAKKHTLLSADDRDVVARWEMEGKAGVEPVVELAFRRDAMKDGTLRIRFRLKKEDFGLAAFFGDYRIRATDAGSSVRQRIFIDSGLWIANASLEEIEAGLREDSKLLRAWLEERLATEQHE